MAQGAVVRNAAQADRDEARAPRTRPIDMEHLANQCLGDENLGLEVLRMFDGTIAGYFGRLRLATAFDELAAHLHTIKGAAAGVGARGVADLARALEDDLRAGRPLKPERIDDLGMAIEEVRSFIAGLVAADEAE